MSGAHIHVPRQHPLVKISLFVEEAGEDNDGRDRVQHAEGSDPHHQLLQFVSLGSVMLHHCSDPEERHEPGQQEDSAQDEVNEEWSQDEASESFDVPQAYVADAAQDVTCNKHDRRQSSSRMNINQDHQRINYVVYSFSSKIINFLPP